MLALKVNPQKLIQFQHARTLLQIESFLLKFKPLQINVSAMLSQHSRLLSSCSQAVSDAYPLPNMEEMAHKVAKLFVFSTCTVRSMKCIS